jgi:DnaJ-class molecular chaperone
VLGVAPDAPREVIEAAGKAMQRKTHPDAGGSEVDFNEVQEAIDEAMSR